MLTKCLNTPGLFKFYQLPESEEFPTTSRKPINIDHAKQYTSARLGLRTESLVS